MRAASPGDRRSYGGPPPTSAVASACGRRPSPSRGARQRPRPRQRPRHGSRRPHRRGGRRVGPRRAERAAGGADEASRPGARAARRRSREPASAPGVRRARRAVAHPGADRQAHGRGEARGAALLRVERHRDGRGRLHLKGSLVGARLPSTRRVTYTHLIPEGDGGLALRCVSRAERSRTTATRWCSTRAVNIGMATAIEDGLVVLVVRGCGPGVARGGSSSRRPVSSERARAGRASAGDDMSGGTFTVSNLGMLPVSGVRGRSSTRHRPRSSPSARSAMSRSCGAGQVVPGKVMTVTLSSDHRIIDGVLAGTVPARAEDASREPAGARGERGRGRAHGRLRSGRPRRRALAPAASSPITPTRWLASRPSSTAMPSRPF